MRHARKPSLPNRISTRLYAGIGLAVGFTLAASIVGWISFQRIDEAQQQVYESSVVQTEAAFALTDFTGDLVAAADDLANATPDQFDEVNERVDSTKSQFRSQLDTLSALVENDAQTERLRVMRRHGNTIISNLSTISADLPRYHELNDRISALKLETDILLDRLDSVLNVATDDQFFYLITGYRNLSGFAGFRDEDLPAAEVSHYLDLASITADVFSARELLSSLLLVQDAAAAEILGAQYGFTLDRAALASRNIPVENTRNETQSLIASLGEFDEGDSDIFSAVGARLDVEQRRRDSLEQNQVAEAQLIGRVADYARTALADSEQASATSSNAIRAGRILLVLISVMGIAGAIAVSWLYVGRLLLRRISRLSNRMRALAGGDLETEVLIRGRDEVADMAAALEVFRQHALEVQRLNLVEKLAQELGDKNEALEVAMEDLSTAQTQIVAQEKLAALGEVTAGVAHEIRNPLNFIKNFSESSEELLDELLEAMGDATDAMSEEDRNYLEEITQDLTGNMKRIISHGSRANRIVEDLLRMGRGVGERQATVLNDLVRDHAMLAYHSARATNADFVVDIQEDFDPEMGELDVVSQDLGRVVLNLVTNAGYATNEKYQRLRNNRDAKESDPTGGYHPTVVLTTKREADHVEIRVRDNGDGIPDDLLQKIFEPFFTTKPTDEGTGLGLALSSDIVRSHGGVLSVDTSAGSFTEFTISLPTHVDATDPGDGTAAVADGSLA